MKGTVDGIHALGMKAGIYSDAGSNTCGSSWNNDLSGIGAGLYGHDDADCRLHFGELGFDFFKVDYCGGLKQKLDERTRYGEIAKAILDTGRQDVRLNICRWAFPGHGHRNRRSWRTYQDSRELEVRSGHHCRKPLFERLCFAWSFLTTWTCWRLASVRRGRIGFLARTGTRAYRRREISHFGMWCMLCTAFPGV